MHIKIKKSKRIEYPIIHLGAFCPSIITWWRQYFN